MKCLIHIGLHHTATTSFQHFLYDQSDFLKKFGILYPSSILDNESKQHSLLPGCFLETHHAINQKRILDPDFYIQKFKEEIISSKLKYCFVSSEVFNELIDCNKEDKIKYIFSKINNFFEDSKILITTRDGKERAYSMYKAKIRQANEVKIFRREIFNAPNIFKQKIINNNSSIKKWKLIGPEIIVKDMDQEKNTIKYYFETITSFMNKDEKEKIKINLIDNINFKGKLDLYLNKDPFLDFEYLITTLTGLKIKDSKIELRSRLNIQYVHNFLIRFINAKEREICMRIKKRDVIKFLLISKGIDIYDVNLLKLLINSGISFESAFMVDNIVNKLINNLILNNDDY
tara:strand:+ start:68 stop:1102 length:1035 start_codon:yes stop_codon:yes gene_type:complete